MKIMVEFDVELLNISEEKAEEMFCERYFIETPSAIIDEKDDWEIIVNNMTLRKDKLRKDKQ